MPARQDIEFYRETKAGYACVEDILRGGTSPEFKDAGSEHVVFEAQGRGEAPE